jgi:hypothetical protein
MSVKLSLKAKKNIKSANEAIATETKNASSVFGSTITWEDSFDAIALQLESAGKGGDGLETLGDKIVLYVKQIAIAFVEVLKDEDFASSLKHFFTAGIVGLLIVPDGEYEKYWRLVDGKLFMLTTIGYFGSYHSYYNSSYLTAILEASPDSLQKGGITTGSTYSFTIKALKNLKAVQGEITSNVASLSKAYGKEVKFDTDPVALLNQLEGKTDIESLGKNILLYVKQASEQVAVFSKDADNLEALQDVWSTDVIGIKIVADNEYEKYWRLENGSLYMLTTKGYFGSYLSYYDAARIESIL